MPVVHVNGTSLYYIEKGTGVGIICIHPPVLTSQNFRFQLHDLSRDYRVLAFDIRGHGKSQPSQQAVTYPLVVEDIVALMDQLNLSKAYLCGYSTGGSIVLDFLMAHPERSLGGIVVGGMSEVKDKKLRKNIRMGLILSKMKAIRTIAFSVSWSNSISFPHFLELYREAKRTHAKNAEQYYTYSLSYNATDQLERIEVPILLLYGEKDKAFHPYAQILHECLPKNELYFIAHADHRVPTKAHDEMNEKIRLFINKYEKNRLVDKASFPSL